MAFDVVLITPLVALVGGVLILVVPSLLNYVVAIYTHHCRRDGSLASLAALSERVERDRRGVRDVKRMQGAACRQPREVVALLANEPAQPGAFGTEYQRDPRRQRDRC